MTGRGWEEGRRQGERDCGKKEHIVETMPHGPHHFVPARGNFVELRTKDHKEQIEDFQRQGERIGI